MSNSKHDGFRSLLYYKFIHSKTHKVDETALKMGISVSTFYNYIEGINNFPVDLVPPLYNATQDIDFLNFTLNNTDQMMTARKPAQVKGGMLEETLDVAASTGKMVAEVQKDMADKLLSVNALKKIEKQINSAVKELEDLRRVLKGKEVL